MFLGPFVSGLIAARAPRLWPGLLAGALMLLAIAMAARGVPRTTRV